MNDEEFLDFWKNIQWPEIKPVYRRLYYSDSGQALFYSQEDLPGKYIDITPEQYAAQDLQVQVVDGKLKPRPKPAPPKLVPGTTGTPCHPDDVAVVVDPQQEHQRWRLKTND